jgi:hypothetical protein
MENIPQPYYMLRVIWNHAKTTFLYAWYNICSTRICWALHLYSKSVEPFFLGGGVVFFVLRLSTFLGCLYVKIFNQSPSLLPMCYHKANIYLGNNT